MIIAATGHRPNKIGNEYDLVGPHSDAIRYCMKAVIDVYKPYIAISGAALGVDMLWGQMALSKHIGLTCAIPFKGQESKWPQSSQKMYNELLQKATEVIFVSEPGYAAWKMQKRNEWMVDNCDTLLALWDGSDGGTANCVRYAQSKGKDIVNIYNTYKRKLGQ